MKDNKNYIMGRDFASNVAAGLSVSSTLFPLESAKKALQQGEKLNLSKVEVFKKLFKTGMIGEYVAYRGLPVFALNIVPTTLIQLTAEKRLEEYIPNDASNAMLSVRALACGTIGATTATIVENTITRQQVLKSKFIPTFIGDMWKESPARMFKTYPFIAIRDSIFTFHMFFLKPFVEGYLKENYPNSVLSSKFVSTIPLAILGATLSHPFDTVATNLQATHDKSDYQKMFNKLVNSNDGYKSLFRGLTFRIPLFYGFLLIIPFIRDECSKLIDKKYSGNQLNGQGFFVKSSDDGAHQAKNNFASIRPK